jgi:hypothetical protein
MISQDCETCTNFFVQKDIKDFIMNTKKSSILYQFLCATKLTPKPQ